MTLYILILGVIVVSAFVSYLFTQNLIAKRIAKVVSLIFLGAFILLFAFVYFHIGAEDKLYLDSFNKPEIKSETESYLVANIITANFGGKVFCSYKPLGALDIEDEMYVWALCQEYYLKENVLTEGTGASLPIAIVVKNGKIIEHKVPRDGSLYSQDIKTIFPKDVQKKISLSQNFISELSSENRLKAQYDTLKIQQSGNDSTSASSMAYNLINGRCTTIECLFNIGNSNYPLGTAVIKGYYSPVERSAWEETMICDSFTITEGSKELIRAMIDLVDQGNAVHSKNQLNQPVINLGLELVSQSEKQSIFNSSVNNQIELIVLNDSPTDTGVPACYQDVMVLRKK